MSETTKRRQMCAKHPEFMVPCVPCRLIEYHDERFPVGQRLDAPPARWQPLTLAEFTRRLRALHRRTTDVDQPRCV